MVIGSSGYIGAPLVRLAEKLGHHVLGTTRERVDINANLVRYSMGDSKFILPDDIEVVIHLAAKNQESLEQDDEEILGLKRLVNECNRVGALMIYVSSQTVLGPLISKYAKSKSIFENIVLSSNGVVVRVGQVYGGLEKGLFGSIVNFLKISPVIPQFFPSPQIQLVHVEDVTSALLFLSEEKTTGIYQLANSKPISFNKFLKLVQFHRVGEFRIILPIPTKILTTAFSLLKFNSHINNIGIRFKTLVSLPYMKPSDIFVEKKIMVRSLHDGMSKTGSARLRKLAYEGRLLGKYLICSDPSIGIVKRYVRYQLISNRFALIYRSYILWKFPALLGLYQAILSSHRGREIQYKIESMGAIAEASCETYYRYMPDCSGCKIIPCTLKMLLAILSELIIKIIITIKLLTSCCKIGR